MLGPLPSVQSRALAAAGLALLGGTALGAYATGYEPYRPVLRRKRIRVPSRWPRLDVLHLSDLHVREGNLRLLRAQQRALERLPVQPDLVCVTGDLCEQAGDAPLVAALLRSVRPRLGTYVILGNHEYDAPPPERLRSKGAGLLWQTMKAIFPHQSSDGPHEAEAIAATLCREGMTVLRNHGLRLDHGDRSLWLAGVDSGWAGRANPDEALRGRDASEGVLALIHEPELAFAAIQHGADLVLAGHTHGGQVRLPLIGAPYAHRVDHRIEIAAGMQHIGSSLLHISVGMGQLMPLRFGCPPELVWLRCEPAEPGVAEPIGTSVLEG